MSLRNVSSIGFELVLLGNRKMIEQCRYPAKLVTAIEEAVIVPRRPSGGCRSRSSEQNRSCPRKKSNSYWLWPKETLVHRG